MFKHNSTGLVFLLRDGGSPDNVDFSAGRTFLPGQQVIGLPEALGADEPRSSFRAVVVDGSGEKLRVRAAHAWWPLPGVKIYDLGQELELQRDEVFGVVLPE